MRLRLYHHPDGARVAYRETGTGPALVLLHSLGLSHREWEPIVAPLSTEIARQISDELTFPGQIKVTVIREVRTIEVAG